jgi:hypothetical protein
MKKLNNVSFIYELVVLKIMTFYQGEYCPFWDEWLSITLGGDFEFTNLDEYGIDLTNKNTGVKRTVWTSNHPYASIADYTDRARAKNRPSRQVMNLFINKYNEHLAGKQVKSNKSYYQELFDNKSN